jgi:hypothetical protein
MAMAQTAFRTTRALNRSHVAEASRMQRAEMPLFQAFLCLSSAKVTDGLGKYHHYPHYKWKSERGKGSQRPVDVDMSRLERERRGEYHGWNSN